MERNQGRGKKRIEQKKRKQKRAHKRNEIHVGAGELRDKSGAERKRGTAGSKAGRAEARDK